MPVATAASRRRRSEPVCRGAEAAVDGEPVRMSRDTEPVVNTWYEDLETGRQFAVVDVDEDEAVVEIQYEDGDTEDIDLDEWYELDLELIESPEDWDDEEGDDEFEEADDLDDDTDDADGGEDWDEDDDSR
jgi:hypothetical protein